MAGDRSANRFCPILAKIVTYMQTYSTLNFKKELDMTNVKIPNFSVNFAKPVRKCSSQFSQIMTLTYDCNQTQKDKTLPSEFLELSPEIIRRNSIS